MGVSTCANCAAALPDGARFCPACGAPAGETIRTERKAVTALFVDIVDSTARAEKLDPEDVRAVLVPYFGRVRSELQRFGGTVEKFIGDAVVALFGAPVAHDDDPERAVRAALAIRETVHDLNAREPSLGLRVRIGVATGEALVTVAASPARGEGMASGDVMNTAARLQEAAGPDGILVGAATARATEGVIAYGPPEQVAAKGKSDPVEARRPLALLEPEAGARRHEGPLVGREHELSLLLGAVERSRRTQTSELVTIVGVPGIGKSRLVAEVRDTLAGEEVSFWYGRSLPYGDAGAFSALGEVVKGIAGILKTDSSEAAERKLATVVAGAVAAEEVPWVAACLRPLVGLAGDGDRDRGAESFVAWRRFFEALAEQRPQVVVVEDLHWADDGLLEFVDGLFEAISDVPLVFLCTSRPELLERRPDWSGGKRNATTMALRPLSDDETTELLRALLATDGPDGAVEADLVARAGGNPLYAEEYVRTLRERGLVGDGGLVPLPETVHGLISARIDGLPDLQKAVLSAAAVVGRTFWGGAVSTAAGLAPAEVDEALQGLERKEFVRRESRSTVVGEREYRFRHVLVRDVAYGQVPRAPRAAQHEATAEWLRRLAADRGDQTERAGVHLLRALELSRAARRQLSNRAAARTGLRAAGERAAQLGSFAAAQQFFDAALDLAPADERDRPALLLAAGRARFHADGTGDALLRAAAAAGDDEVAGEAEVTLAVLALRGGDPSDAFAHVDRATSLLAGALPSPAKTEVLATAAGLLMMAGRHADAARAAGEALTMAEHEDLAALQAHALTTLGVARASEGAVADGIADLERAVEIAIAAGSPESIRALSNLASLTTNEGDLRRSAEVGGRAWDEALRFGSLGVLPFLESERAAAAFWSGRWEEAHRIADEVIARESAPAFAVSACRQLRAEMRLAEGDVDGALDDADADLEAARRTDDAQQLFPALSLRARCAVAAGQTEEARDLVDEVLARWDEAGAHLRPSSWATDLVIAATATGAAQEFDRRAAASSAPTRWLEAARALALGSRERAAELYRAIGSRPDEAAALGATPPWKRAPASRTPSSP